MITGSISKDKHGPLHGSDDLFTNGILAGDRAISESLQKFDRSCRNETGLDRAVHYGSLAYKFASCLKFALRTTHPPVRVHQHRLQSYFQSPNIFASPPIYIYKSSNGLAAGCLQATHSVLFLSQMFSCRCFPVVS